MEKLSILFVFGIFIAVGSTITLVLIPEGESGYAQNGTLIGNTTVQNQTMTTQNDTLAPFGLEQARQGEEIGQQEAVMGEAIGQEFANEFRNQNQNQNDSQLRLEEARQGEEIGQQEAVMGEQIGKDYANEWK